MFSEEKLSEEGQKNKKISIWNLFTHIYLLVLNITERVFEFSGPTPAFISGPRPPVPIKIPTTSTSSYLKFSHYGTMHIIFNGLRVI